MTEILLCQVLRALISDAVGQMSLQCPDGTFVAPEVFNGFLPFRTQDREGFPFVVVRPTSSTMNEETVAVDVLISIGCYYALSSGENASAVDGYEEAMTVMEKIRQALVDLPNGVLDCRYLFTMPVTVSIPEDQAAPYWQIDMTTTWNFRRPVMTNWSEL